MRKLSLRVPMFGFIVATRAAFAFGAGLLLSDKIPADRRRTIGLSLVALGAATTIPAIIAIRGNLSRETSPRPLSAVV